MPTFHWTPKAILFPLYHTFPENEVQKCVGCGSSCLHLLNGGYEIYLFFRVGFQEISWQDFIKLTVFSSDMITELLDLGAEFHEECGQTGVFTDNGQ